MNDNRSINSAGGKIQRGISIEIIGPYRSLVGAVSDIVSKTLLNSGKRVALDSSLYSQDETILNANMRLLDTAATNLSSESTSLLVAVKLRHRLKTINDYLNRGVYTISNYGWLDEAVYYESISNKSVVNNILVDYTAIKSDVWVAIDSPEGAYAKLAEKAGIKVLTSDLTPKQLAEDVMALVLELEKSHLNTNNPKKNTQQNRSNKLSILDCLENNIVIPKLNPELGYKLPSMNSKISKVYRRIMGKLTDNLNLVTKDFPGSTIALGITPIASLLDIDNTEVKISPAKSIKTIENLLPVKTDLNRAMSLQLIHAEPRNEFDILTSLAYKYTNQPTNELQNEINNLIYEKKAMLLQNLKKSSDGVETNYIFEGIVKVQELLPLCGEVGVNLDIQPLTPFYGYDIEEGLVSTEAEEVAQKSYDLSLKLFSSLQEAGYSDIASNALLLGHFCRAKINITFTGLLSLKARNLSISESLISQAANMHPLLFSN